MGTLQVARYEQGRPMLFAGIRRRHAFANIPRDIPNQWRDFEKLGALPGQIGSTAYGAICSGDPKTQTMEYMCAVEVASFDPVPKELGRMRVPAVRYAVFLHGGPVGTVRETWDDIIARWLPRSGMRSAHTPDFEVYDERFDPRTGLGGIEIWVGVVAGS